MAANGYWCYWHGAAATRASRCSSATVFSRNGRRSVIRPSIIEERIVVADLGPLTVASVYVPNGGKDYDAKMRFLEALVAWAAETQAPAGR